MKAFLKRQNVILAWACAAVLCGVVAPKQAWAECACRGDMGGFMGCVIPDGWVGPEDLMCIILLLQSYGPPYVAPAFEMPCADVADVNAMGLQDGDGQVDIGDLNFLVCYVYLCPFYYCEECAPIDYAGCPADPNILIWVNDTPWDGVSQVVAGDVIKVGWDENETAWCAGFSNFNLNVSRGDYLDNFNTLLGWDLINFSAEPDGQGGINVGGGCSSLSPYSGLVFTFSFQIPLEVGPAYTIHIRPTQGSWRRVMFDQLPTVDLEVKACVELPEYDLNDNCKIDLRDFAVLASQWQQAPGVPSADFAPAGGDGIVDIRDLAVFTTCWLQGAE